MAKGVKTLLLGCGFVIVIGVVGIGVGGYMLKNWVHTKSEQVGNLLGTKDSEYGKKSEELQKEYPFVEPADHLISEAQLQRFLSVRKSLHSIWKQHEAEFKEMEKNKERISGALKGLEIVQEVRKVQLAALEKAKMSPNEYAYVDSAVYGAMVMEMTNRLANDLIQLEIDNVNKQLEQPGTTGTAREKLTEMKHSMEKMLADKKAAQQQEIDSRIAATPAENTQLFKLHEQEINQYWMEGLQSLTM